MDTLNDKRITVVLQGVAVSQTGTTFTEHARQKQKSQSDHRLPLYGENRDRLGHNGAQGKGRDRSYVCKYINDLLMERYAGNDELIARYAWNTHDWNLNAVGGTTGGGTPRDYVDAERHRRLNPIIDIFGCAPSWIGARSVYGPLLLPAGMRPMEVRNVRRDPARQVYMDMLPRLTKEATEEFLELRKEEGRRTVLRKQIEDLEKSLQKADDDTLTIDGRSIKSIEDEIRDKKAERDELELHVQHLRSTQWTPPGVEIPHQIRLQQMSPRNVGLWFTALTDQYLIDPTFGAKGGWFDRKYRIILVSGPASARRKVEVGELRLENSQLVAEVTLDNSKLDGPNWLDLWNDSIVDILDESKFFFRCFDATTSSEES